jgi:hypothetical protein
MKQKLVITFIAILGIIFDIHAQKKVENLVIITLDGMRWQEIFGGIDSTIVKDQKFNQKSAEYIFKKYGGNDPLESRKKLMPFLWTTLQQKGQIFGNRQYENYVNVSNPYWVSYPGYSEIFCGMVDTSINSNKLVNNPNINFLEIINQNAAFKNRVVAFGAWNAFPYILNTDRNHIPLSSAFNPIVQNPSNRDELIHSMLRQSFKPFNEGECLDVFTHFQAMEYLKIRKPKVIYIGYGETDEWAHAGKYKYYLDAANQTDNWISEIWNYIQNEPTYKDNTLLFITTDHGRGVKELWTDHNNKVSGADQAWFAIYGPGIKPIGEVKQKGQIYHKQFAYSITDFLGIHFLTNGFTVKPLIFE